MMGLFSRLRTNFQARANQAVDRMEDPRVNLNYSLRRLEDNRRELVNSLVEALAAHHSLIEERGQLESNLLRLDSQAQAAIHAGRDDLARQALQRKQALIARLPALEEHIENLGMQVEALRQAQALLDQKIRLLKSKKEELKSVYDSTRAQLRVREALSGISMDLADVGNTIQRTEERIQSMRSRMYAIQQLTSEGALPDLLEEEDLLERQLLELKRNEMIEAELRSLRLLASPESTEIKGEEE